MSIGFRIDNPGAFLDLKIQQAKMDQDIRAALRDMARSYRAKAVAELRRPKGGRQYGGRVGRAFYRRQRVTVQMFGGGTGSTSRLVRTKRATRAYRASAPGEPPAMLTGTLAKSVRVKFPTQGKGYTARVFAAKATAYYRHFLEFGHGPARKGRKGRTGPAAARPLWSPLQAQIERELPARLLAAVDTFVQGRR